MSSEEWVEPLASRWLAGDLEHQRQRDVFVGQGTLKVGQFLIQVQIEF